jgi:hypothetical protein
MVLFDLSWMFMKYIGNTWLDSIKFFFLFYFSIHLQVSKCIRKNEQLPELGPFHCILNGLIKI